MNELILTFFYSGKAKKAPGTFGSATALGFWFLLSYFFADKISLVNQNIFWVIFLIAILIYGCFFIKNYAAKFGQIDHKSIVLDEVLGQVLALQISFNFIKEDYFSDIILIAKHLFFCFVFFRLFDITKPLFIGWCDRNLKNGFGVMFDDLLCGIIAAAITIFLLHYVG